MKTEVINFLKKHKAMREFEAELLNIGNYTAEEAIRNSTEECAVVSLFSDENYLQYDSSVTAVDWGEINKLWINKLDKTMTFHFKD